MNSALPKVTIITVCRNSGDTIEETIRSVIGQGYDNLEYIIVDAESDDGTAGIIERYKQHVHVWIREPDDGIADAWNKGIGRATGEVIGIINADDRYTAGTIAAVVDAFAREPGCGFVFGDLDMTDGAGRAYRVFGRADYQRTSRYRMILNHPTMFVKRRIYDEVGPFNTGYRICPDYELARRMIARGVEGAYIPRLLAVMREGGLSERARAAAAREQMVVSIRYGFNPLLARCYFSVNRLRFCFGKTIERLGLSLSTQRRLVHGIGWRRIFRSGAH